MGQLGKEREILALPRSDGVAPITAMLMVWSVTMELDGLLRSMSNAQSPVWLPKDLRRIYHLSTARRSQHIKMKRRKDI